jgi:hypothetical protein
MIWESHYSRVEGQFGMEIQWQCYNDISIGRNFDRILASIIGLALPAILENWPSRNKAYTLLFLLPTSPGSPSQWNTCRASLPPGGEMNLFLWLLITFPRWRFWPPPRRASRQRTLPRFSLNECGYTLGSHKSLFQIRTVVSSTHYG